MLIPNVEVLPRTLRADVLVFLLWIRLLCSYFMVLSHSHSKCDLPSEGQRIKSFFFFRSPNAHKAIGMTSAPVGPRTAVCTTLEGPTAVVSSMVCARCGWDFHCTTIMKVSFFTKWSCRLFPSQGRDVKFSVLWNVPFVFLFCANVREEAFVCACACVCSHTTTVQVSVPCGMFSREVGA